MQKAADGAVGAKKECLYMQLLVAPMWCYMAAQNTDEGVALMQNTANKLWGNGCERLMQTAAKYTVRSFSWLPVRSRLT